MKLANPFLTVGYAGPEYFCDRKQETEELIQWDERSDLLSHKDFVVAQWHSGCRTASR